MLNTISISKHDYLQHEHLKPVCDIEHSKPKITPEDNFFLLLSKAISGDLK
jgi:hypothetical protein